MDASAELTFGELAIKAGYLDRKTFENLLEKSQQPTDQNKETSLAELCQTEGLLTQEQVQRIQLDLQFASLYNRNRRLGSMAIDMEASRKEAINSILKWQKQDYQEKKKLPAPLGRILLEKRVLKEEELGPLEEACTRLQEKLAAPLDESSFFFTAPEELVPTRSTETKKRLATSYAYVFRPNPSFRLPSLHPARTGKIICPHCWELFKVEETLFVARHEELTGDPVLGTDAAERFLPSRFTPEGNAIDPAGMECPDRACPRCHLRIPRAIYERGSIFLSIVGAPASGKSYFLSAMTWALRRKLPEDFQFLFSDTDAETNQWLNAQEETLFLPEKKGKTVFLKKTELHGDHYNQVMINGMTMQLPSPSIFTIQPHEHHPRYEKSIQNLTRNIILYDNAGEHFQPGMDTQSNPGTQHLLRSQAIFFLFDPVSDPRMKKKCQEIDSTLKMKTGKPQRQETLLTEMVNRISRYRGVPANTKVDLPLFVVVTKYDVWKKLLPRTPVEDPFRASEKLSMSAIDMDEIISTSFLVRELLLETCPEIVNTAEGFSRYVFYIPVSSLGHAPKLGKEGGFVVNPENIKPWWVTVPMSCFLAQTGYIPILRRPTNGENIPTAEVSITGDKIKAHVPGTSVEYTLPFSFTNCTPTCPKTGVKFRIPALRPGMPPSFGP